MNMHAPRTVVVVMAYATTSYKVLTFEHAAKSGSKFVNHHYILLCYVVVVLSVDRVQSLKEPTHLNKILNILEKL